MHWAVKWIGRSYEEVGQCWGLVRSACMERFGEDMPVISVGTIDDQTAAIKRAAHGWVQAKVDRPAADDIVVMERAGTRHVGFAIAAPHLGILHASRLGVVFQDWPEMARAGFHSFEFWRKR